MQENNKWNGSACSWQVAETPEDLQAMMNLDKNAVVITRESLVPEIKGMPLRVVTSHRDLFETPATVLLKQIPVVDSQARH